ncbi:hypothetical protein LTSERUB_6207 [Salmonella enterica subsp. enterica serovar Rubislaw str. A4-653]|uniref:Uncharacterized protein n=1 Tax=Salmonella enterica subsp. enterica serovar Rubislaw str. A4-653 TaxID=913081 RepID=G5QSL3_SALRU|nr:hypothetical protein LTSERUB_6207 [Salmonella enterica subsp. enterica serovar Rubislaw str. A4-653]
MKGTAVVKQCETLLAPYSAKRLVTKKSVIWGNQQSGD